MSKTAHIASDDVRIARTNVSPLANADSPNGPFAPADIRHAYGFDSILLGGSVVGDGTGQTIAVIDPYNDPNIASDLDAFDNSFSINGGSQKIYQQYGPASTFFTVLQLQGTPPNAPLDGWAEEMSLDVEWLHALAPKAHIDLFEALSPNVVNADGSEGDMLKAVDSARATTGVSVVSMSWGVPEFANESNYDSHFTSLTGPGDPFVTFLAATGDTGSPGAYPAYSPNVVAVGGTLLNIESFAGNYLGETAWSGSGGGTSQFESEPSFQSSLQSTTKRTIPDVSANSGSRTDGSDVSIYDSYDIGGNHWGAAYGTSFSVLVWGATVAIADQGRANIGLPSLDGPSQTLPEIYKLPSSHIWDITSGSNGGFQAGPGYDEVTGRGTPMANMAAPNLVPGVISPSSLQSSIVSSQVAQVGNLNEQDVFVVGSDGLVREDRFFYGTGQSTGQAIIDPTTTFNAGTKLSVYSDGSSTNVFAVGQDGKLKWAQYTKTGGWTAFVTVDSLISGSDITFPAGAPLAGYASSGNFDLFAVANDGYVRQYAYYTSSHSWQSYSFGNAYSFGAGAPLAVWDSGSHVDIFGIYPDGTLERLRYVSGWVPSNYGADGQAPPRGSLAIWESGSFTDLYAVTASGDVDEIYSNDGTTWHGGNVVSVGSNKLTTGQQLAIA
ncbi:MAG TPA: hypothetical protein VFI31_26210, partial [Pirellulales bacterium]|nr:hypothetical protein [Pirellulales bacterium]